MPLDKLFPYAPIMVLIGNTFKKRTFYTRGIRGEYLYLDLEDEFNLKIGTQVRLPEPETSPKNTWLAPWEVYPHFLNTQKVLVWWKDSYRDIGVYDSINIRINWNHIQAIMLLKDVHK